MGSRNLDRVPLRDRRHQGETVGQMRAAGWRLQAHCGSCRLAVNMSLDPIICMRGPQYSLWDRKMKCPKDGCRGQATFYAKAPGMTGYQAMITVVREPDPPWWMRSRGASPPDPE